MSDGPSTLDKVLRQVLKSGLNSEAKNILNKHVRVPWVALDTVLPGSQIM